MLKGLNESSLRFCPHAAATVSFFKNVVSNGYRFSLCAGGLCLWLILWLVVVKPGGVRACPRLCVCYPTPMTVSCQSQNLTIVPAGVPYNSQRVFLQNNRITELRTDSFGFETQVKEKIPVCLFQHSGFLLRILISSFSSSCAQVLWLYGNNITWIESGAFSNLRVLEELDLGDNPLQRLEGGAFRGLEKLQSLHMHRCKLAALPHDLFHKLYSLQFLYLQVNPASPHQLQNMLRADNTMQELVRENSQWREWTAADFTCKIHSPKAEKYKQYLKKILNTSLNKEAKHERKRE